MTYKIGPVGNRGRRPPIRSRRSKAPASFGKTPNGRYPAVLLELGNPKVLEGLAFIGEQEHTMCDSGRDLTERSARARNSAHPTSPLRRGPLEYFTDGLVEQKRPVSCQHARDILPPP